MSSHHDCSAESGAEDHWRALAVRAGYDHHNVARLLKLSLRQLERQCRRALGCTPREWLHRERMMLAARLLAEGQPAKCVALRLNYSQLANFSRDFKRHHGQSPTAYAPRPQLFPVVPVSARAPAPAKELAVPFSTSRCRSLITNVVR